MSLVHATADLCVVPVAVERAVPLRAFQGAVVRGRLAPEPAADSQGLLQIPGKHLPFLGPGLVVVHVVILGAPILVEQQALYCHVFNHLHMHQVISWSQLLLIWHVMSVNLTESNKSCQLLPTAMASWASPTANARVQGSEGEEKYKPVFKTVIENWTKLDIQTKQTTGSRLLVGCLLEVAVQLSRVFIGSPD